jgi:hypothetical protein
VPVISIFNGIVVRMYYFDSKQHAESHVHVQYGDKSAVFAIQDGLLLAGEIPIKQTRLIQAWIELRREDLAADWLLAASGARISAIEPLR